MYRDEKEMLGLTVAIVILVITLCACGWKAGQTVEQRKWQRELIKKNHAEYIVDEQGNPKFQLKEIQK